MKERDGPRRFSADSEQPGFIGIATTSAELYLQCRSALSAFGSVRCVTDWREMTSLVSEIPITLLIVDRNLPGLSGSGGIEKLLRCYPMLRVLVVIDKSEDEPALSLLRAGVSGYCERGNVRGEVAKAFRVIVDGELWAERRVVSQLLNELRGGIKKKPDLIEVVHKLTPREKDITRLVSEGMCQKSIASHLAISQYTVRNHLRNIFDKTGVSSRLQLALLVKND